MEWSAIYPLLMKALWESVYMVSVGTLAAIVIGLPISVILIITDAGSLLAAPALNRILGSVVNVGRSMPFIILLVTLTPLTRLIVGTTIGTRAAVVPIAIAAIPFFARIAETALREVDRGLVEAAQAMGCSVRQIIVKVLIPEALPGLVLGVTITIIAMLNYSAMAGAVGGGGLGDLAIRYGYQRFEVAVMIITIIVLIALVQIVQFCGDYAARRIRKR